MIYLVATTDTLRIVTSSGAAVHIAGFYVQAVAATGVWGSASPVVATVASATNTDLLSGPGSGNFYSVKQLTIRNTDASLAVDITIQLLTSGADPELWKETLQPGEQLIYIEGVGFFRGASVAGVNKMLIMSGDSTHATAATFADITGLTCPMKSGIRYSVLACLFSVNNASTTGSQFGYNIGAAPTLALFGEIGAVTNSVTGGAFGTGTATARDTAIVAQTTGQTATGIHLIGGMIQPSADGTFAMRATSEVSVAAGLVVKAGSWLRILQER